MAEWIFKLGVRFAHFWLGKRQALTLGDNEYVEQFCRFVSSMGAKENYIAPLRAHLKNTKLLSVGDMIEF